MPELGLATIDTSVQETNRWLDRVMSELDTDDKQQAYQSLRAVLITLRDRLPVDLGAGLGAQLPLLIRGIYYEAYVPAEVPSRHRRPDEWRDAIARAGDNIDSDQAARASRAVFRVLGRELDSGIVGKVRDSLPKELSEDLH